MLEFIGFVTLILLVGTIISILYIRYEKKEPNDPDSPSVASRPGVTFGGLSGSESRPSYGGNLWSEQDESKPWKKRRSRNRL